MRNQKLSVMIIAKDEEEMIADCLESVKWADETIVVVDDRTVDKTVEIAQKYTDKVYTNKFDSFGQQCQFAFQKATGGWIFKLDADERITPDLKTEILKKIKSKKFDAYHAYFRPVFLGKEFQKSNVRIQGTVRLFRRERGRFLPLSIHERLEIKGKVGVLNNEILHLTYRTLSQTLGKFNHFSSLEAEELYKRGGRTNSFFVVLAPARIFLRCFFWEGNYLNGAHGFIYSLLCAHYYLIKHLKIWELMQKEN